MTILLFIISTVILTAIPAYLTLADFATTKIRLHPSWLYVPAAIYCFLALSVYVALSVLFSVVLGFDIFAYIVIALASLTMVFFLTPTPRLIIDRFLFLSSFVPPPNPMLEFLHKFQRQQSLFTNEFETVFSDFGVHLFDELPDYAPPPWEGSIFTGGPENMSKWEAYKKEILRGPPDLITPLFEFYDELRQDTDPSPLYELMWDVLSYDFFMASAGAHLRVFPIIKRAMDLQARHLPIEFSRLPELWKATANQYRYIHLDQSDRFKTMWILASPGKGKTTLLHSMVKLDIASGNSVIMLDSKGDFIDPIMRWKDLPRERTVIIDPRLNPPLNPFLLEGGRTHIINHLIYVFGGMFEFGFTPTQTTCFVKILDCVLRLPNPRFSMVRDFLQDRGAQYLKELPDDEHFIKRELTTTYRESKGQISTRLDYLLVLYPFLEKMLNAPSAIPIGKYMDEGKIIIINANRAVLGEAVNMFGRIFIAMVRQAAARRAITKIRTPVCFYLDEAHDYIAHDTKITEIMDQCRSFNIALIVAHQRLGHLSAPVQEALFNSHYKLINTQEGEERFLARFNVEKVNYGRGIFVLNVGGFETKTVIVEPTKYPSMSRKDFKAFMDSQRYPEETPRRADADGDADGDTGQGAEEIKREWRP